MLELTVDEDAVVQRLLKRAETEGRADDTEDVIRERQEIYVDGDGAAGRRSTASAACSSRSTAWATVDEVGRRRLEAAARGPGRAER